MTSSESAPGNGAVHNAWVGEQGPGAFDLRSDTMTVPTASMLSAIQRCTLKDDVFREDPTTEDLESHVAALSAKEAGLFVLSGTMGNQVALRALLVQPPYSVLCDPRSHIWKYEAGGTSTLTGAMMTPVTPKNGIHLTLEDVKASVILGDDVHDCPTRVISLENTLNGMIMPLKEVERISDFAREHGIKMHCDGARLWEAVVSGAGTLPEFCSHFDTISLCFSKGLGAPVGSIIVGETATIKHCRWTRKAIGGGTRQPGLLTAAARVAVDETFGKAADGSEGWLRTTHEMAKRVEKAWTAKGGKVGHPVHTNMLWMDLEGMGIDAARFNEIAQENGLATSAPRLITHYQVAQRGDEVMEKLERVFEQVCSEAGTGAKRQKLGQDSIYQSR